jgi:hypothetical protein
MAITKVQVQSAVQTKLSQMSNIRLFSPTFTADMCTRLQRERQRNSHNAAAD